MSGPSPSLGPEFWGEERITISKKGSKSGPSSKYGQSEMTERECEKLEANKPPFSAAAESTLLFKMQHGGRKSGDAFLLFELTHAKQWASVSKFALSLLSKFQMEVRYTKGKFAPGQKNSASVLKA